MDWLIWMVFPLLLSEIRAINLNPFAGFADPQYEPVADYSIHRGVYLPNMPTTSIFPIMSDENINGMVGIPSLQTPFVNPLLQQQPSLFTVAKQAVRSKAKNTRINQAQHPSGGIREQGSSQQKPRGVTLDVRGGGYRLEQSRSQRPYKPPGSGGNPVRNTAQRNNNGRNTASSVNRKQLQRPRGSALNNPQFNLGSISPNAEFVNPESVLPLHPRIYKQFLQQNPQAAAYLRAQKPASPNFAGVASSNPFNVAKQVASKFTRNRGIPQASQLTSLSPFSGVTNNFQIPTAQKPGAQLASHFGLQGQSIPSQPTFEDFYNSDPQFYTAFSQTPEGKAMLRQMYQHFGSSANKPNLNSPNKTPANVVPNANPFAATLADINSYAAAAGYGAGNTFQPGQSANQFANSFGASGHNNGHFNKQNIPGYALSSQYGQNPPQSIPQQPSIPHQSPLQHQQAMHHSSISQQQQPPQPHSHISSNQQDYTGRQPFTETAPPSRPNPEPKKQYPSSQGGRNQFNPYPRPTYSDDSSSSFASGGPGYDPSTYKSPYQENPKAVDGSTVDGSTVDHTEYGSNFSPVDPLATVENPNGPGNVPSAYYNYPQSDSSPYGVSSSRFPSTALHEISPSEAVKRPSESSNSYRTQPANSPNSPGYWTPEQLFAPQSTGLQSDSPYAYSSAMTSSNSQPTQDEQQDGSERAALHLPEDAAAWPVVKAEEVSIPEYGEASEPDVDEIKDSPASTEQPESSPSEEESDEHFKATIRDLQKLWTRVPQRSSTTATRATTVIYRSTEPPEVMKTTRDDLKNHKTTPSYTYQYSISDKTGSKSTAAWWSRKPDGSRYKIPAPQPNTTTTPSTTPSTTAAVTTTHTTTTTKTTTTTESPEPTFNFNIFTTTPASTSIATTPYSTTIYQDTDTPICARHNNLTYCLQDPEYPKEAIQEAIERNRHPLDHFLVDISTASNVVDDQSLHTVFENSAPLQSTSVSYSFEGKVISPNAGEMLNSTGCNSNVYYAKPLRALNTAGLWKVIVNVEFEDTGANYTQTVRIEECTHPPGYVATCGVHSISACLQQYKLYRLLSWEAHRGFYIDAFLLPVACFCGSQES